MHFLPAPYRCFVVLGFPVGLGRRRLGRCACRSDGRPSSRPLSPAGKLQGTTTTHRDLRGDATSPTHSKTTSKNTFNISDVLHGDDSSVCRTQVLHATGHADQPSAGAQADEPLNRPESQVGSERTCRSNPEFKSFFYAEGFLSWVQFRALLHRGRCLGTFFYICSSLVTC